MLTTLKVLVFVSSLQQHLVLNLHFIENNSKYQFYWVSSKSHISYVYEQKQILQPDCPVYSHRLLVASSRQTNCCLLPLSLPPFFLLYWPITHSLTSAPFLYMWKFCFPNSRQMFHLNWDLLCAPLCFHYNIIHSCFSWMEKANGRKGWEGEAGHPVSLAKANNVVQVCLDLALEPCCMITSVLRLVFEL